MTTHPRRGIPAGTGDGPGGRAAGPTSGPKGA